MTKWVEVRKGDRIVFKEKNGKGSVVKVKNKGFYFMPAKIGMRLNGAKSPIGKSELFIVNDFVVIKYEGEYLVNCHLTRCKDSTQFIVNERNFQKYFAKINQSSLGDYSKWVN